MKQGSNKIYSLVAGLCIYVFFLATAVASATSSDWYYRAKDVSTNSQVIKDEAADGWQAVGQPYDLPIDEQSVLLFGSGMIFHQRMRKRYNMIRHYFSLPRISLLKFIWMAGRFMPMGIWLREADPAA